MDIRFNCPHCQKGLKAPQDKAGRRFACPSCKQPVEVPKPDAEPPLEELVEVFDEQPGPAACPPPPRPRDAQPPPVPPSQPATTLRVLSDGMIASGWEQKRFTLAVSLDGMPLGKSELTEPFSYQVDTTPGAHVLGLVAAKAPGLLNKLNALKEQRKQVALTLPAAGAFLANVKLSTRGGAVGKVLSSLSNALSGEWLSVQVQLAGPPGSPARATAEGAGGQPAPKGQPPTTRRKLGLPPDPTQQIIDAMYAMQDEQESERQLAEARHLAETWECVDCRMRVRIGASVCPHCGRKMGFFG